MVCGLRWYQVVIWGLRDGMGGERKKLLLGLSYRDISSFALYESFCRNTVDKFRLSNSVKFRRSVCTCISTPLGTNNVQIDMWENVKLLPLIFLTTVQSSGRYERACNSKNLVAHLCDLLIINGSLAARAAQVVDNSCSTVSGKYDSAEQAHNRIVILPNRQEHRQHAPGCISELDQSRYV